MSRLNCPNCGAVIDIDKNKCPYCDTSYYDLSAIDIKDRKPFYLKVRNGDVTLTSLVIIDTLDYTLKTEPGIAYCGSHRIATFEQSNTLDINMNLIGISEKGVLIKAEMKGDK